MNDLLWGLIVISIAGLLVSLTNSFIIRGIHNSIKMPHNGGTEIKTISDGVESLLSEFLPKGGASVSYRMNDQLRLSGLAAENAIAAKQVAQSITDTVARMEQGIAKAQEKVDSLTRVVTEQNKTINNIIQNSGEAEQVLAGKGAQDKT